MDSRLDQKINSAFSRRSFLAGAGGLAAATTLAGCGSNNPQVTTAATTPTTTAVTDADVLNFALNLEYLEAQFYLYAATGKGLATTDTVAPSGYTGTYTVGTVTTNSTVTMVQGTTTAQQNIIAEIAYEEQEHVRFLRAALGSAAVPMPNIDLTFFAGLATAATIPVTGFTPFSSFPNFLLGSFIFEDVGVTAYTGAATLISAAGVAAGYLTAAAGILAVEAYHAAYVRTAITGAALAANSPTGTISYANLIANLRATLTVGNSAAPSASGSVETNLVYPAGTPSAVTSASAIVPASPTTAVGFARTVNQVAHIVYGSATVGVAKGGFFPSGLNSRFATTTA